MDPRSLDALGDDMFNVMLDYLDLDAYFTLLNANPRLKPRSLNHNLRVYLAEFQRKWAAWKAKLDTVMPLSTITLDGKNVQDPGVANPSRLLEANDVYARQLLTLTNYAYRAVRSELAAAQANFLTYARLSELRGLMAYVDKNYGVYHMLLTPELAVKLASTDMGLFSLTPLGRWGSSLTPSQYEELTGGDYTKMRINKVGPVGAGELLRAKLYGSANMTVGMAYEGQVGPQNLPDKPGPFVILASVRAELETAHPDVSYLRKLNEVHTLTNAGTFRLLVASLMPYFFLGQPEWVLALPVFLPVTTFSAIHELVSKYSETEWRYMRSAGREYDLSGYEASKKWLLEYLPYGPSPPAY